jgi:hypothetical protein
MKNRTKYILLSLFLCFLFIVVHQFKKGPHKACEQRTANIKSLYLQGIVTNKYEDKENHGYETVVVKNEYSESTFRLIGDKSTLFDSICIGDSIYKNSGTMDFLLVMDTLQMTFTVDFDCENIRGWD